MSTGHGHRWCLVVVVILLCFVNTWAAAQREEQGSDSALSPTSRPLQIIKPDPTHTKLVIDEENIRRLYHINRPLAVVGVVGPYHSGKSFLLNQLLGRTQGFALGPTVTPSTMGVWVWGEPIRRESMDVIFLDTEGFYASNVSEAYDAKIFTLATLLSSVLLYNSVKMIDQAAIDYLELLARRAQLFAVKANIYNETAFLTNALLKFPNFIWVVEDFFQDTQGKTPTEWLEAMIFGGHRDYAADDRDDGSNPDAVGSLRDIFPSMECHTLFLPHTEREKLRHLDRISNEELHPDYRKELSALRERVFQLTKPKLSNNEPSSYLDGPGFVRLVRLLVDSANSGSFPHAPSVWKAFIAMQAQQGFDDCLNLYKQSMQPRGDETLEELETSHKNTMQKIEQIFSTLLFGHSNPESFFLKLKDSISDLYDLYVKRTNEEISRKCQKAYAYIRDRIQDKADGLTLPISEASLKARLDAAVNPLIDEFQQTLLKYSGHSSYSHQLRTLQRDVEDLKERVREKNKRLILAKLEEGVIRSKSELVDFFNRQNLPLGVAQLKQLQEVAEKRGIDSLQSHCSSLLGTLSSKSSEVESSQTYTAIATTIELPTEFYQYQTRLKSELRSLFEEFKRRNDAEISKQCIPAIDQAIDIWKRQALTLILPVDQSAINEAIHRAELKVDEFWSSYTAPFKGLPAIAECSASVQKRVNEQMKLLISNNFQQTKLAVADALEAAKKEIVVINPNYFLFYSEARRVATQELEKRGKNLSPDLRRGVIEDWIETDLRDVRDATLSALVRNFLVPLALVLLAAIFFLATKK